MEEEIERKKIREFFRCRKNSADSIVSRVKSANRTVYNRVDPNNYNQNESNFNFRRQQICREILKTASEVSGNEKYLDVGTGTGNLLRLARDYFRFCVGIDISDQLLAKILNDIPYCKLLSADSENLPFLDSVFNCVSCYALLHHLYQHEITLHECYRVLKSGGTLYIDHDPNFFFHRFYHIYYKIRYLGTHGFGSEIDDLAEYHYAFTSGINPEKNKENSSRSWFQ